MAKKKIPAPIGKRYFTVEDSIFKRTVHVLLNYTDEQWLDWQKRHKITNPDAGAGVNFDGFSTQADSAEDPTEWIIFIKRFNWTIDDQGTLIHEIVHTIIKIFANNNIPFNHDTQEFIAHSVSNLYEDIAGRVFHKRRRA